MRSLLSLGDYSLRKEEKWLKVAGTVFYSCCAVTVKVPVPVSHLGHVHSLCSLVFSSELEMPPESLGFFLKSYKMYK